MAVSSPLKMLPAALNHLLASEPWACAKLRAHAGKVACLDAGVLAVRLQIAADGMLETAEAQTPANVTIRLQLSDLPLLLQDRERAFALVKIDGDADLANTISQVGQSLRWEAAEDLSKLVGDIAAQRIVTSAASALAGARRTQQALAENLAEYFLEEKPMLLRPQAVSDFGADVAKLRDDTERMAKRIEKLSKLRAAATSREKF